MGQPVVRATKRQIMPLNGASGFTELRSEVASMRERGVGNIGIGERGRNRTFNLLIKSQLLCQLSYAPFEEIQLRTSN